MKRTNPKLNRGRTTLRTGTVLLTLMTVGCTGPRKFEPTVDPVTLADTQFLHYLATVPAVTVNEANRAVLILANGHDPFDNPADRMAELQRRDIIRPAWRLEPTHTLDRATAAYMLFKTTGMPGGVNTLLLGSWGLGDRHYALREMTAAGMLEYGSDHDLITGGEFVAALGRADAYMAENEAYKQDPNAPVIPDRALPPQ